jgi:hypothetical protein
MGPARANPPSGARGDRPRRVRHRLVFNILTGESSLRAVIQGAVEAGRRRAQCVRCFFGIRAAVTRNADRYQLEFGALALC